MGRSGGSTLPVVGLDFLGLPVHHQVRFQEFADVAVQDVIDVARLVLGAHVLHQLVGLQHIVADLAAPLDLLLARLDLAALATATLQLGFIKL